MTAYLIPDTQLRSLDPIEDALLVRELDIRTPVGTGSKAVGKPAAGTSVKKLPSGPFTCKGKAPKVKARSLAKRATVQAGTLMSGSPTEVLATYQLKTCVALVA